MKFEKEPLFRELVSKYGMNLYIGAGFSVYAYNCDGESLPLGKNINNELIKNFSLDQTRSFSLSKTCQKIKKENEDALNRFLRDKYTVKSFDPIYNIMPSLPVKNIVTLNIDNLLEKVYDTSLKVSLTDSKIYGSLEERNSVNLYKVHGSVTYSVEERMSFTERELTDLFLREKKLFETVSYKLSTAPTIFWGTSLYDNNTLELIYNSEEYSKAKTQKWIVVYPEENNKEFIEDYQEQGFNIIEADTKELLQYLCEMDYVERTNKGSSYKYGELFPKNYISAGLQKISVRRPVVDFFTGAEPQISDVLSKNVARISYFDEVINKILIQNIVLVTGIPGCGKSTLLLQLAFSNEISGIKFWFNNITKQEAERLKKIVETEKNQVIIFIDNLYTNIEAFKVLNEVSGIKLVLAERALNFEYIKRSLNIDLQKIVDISNLCAEDIQIICKCMNRPSQDAVQLITTNENTSLLEIVFFATTSVMINERIRRYIDDLRSFHDSNLRINLLELFALINYTSYCGAPCSMDMLFFYFSEEIDNYGDILYALNKMTKIIVESEDRESEYANQDYLVMRSKLFAERSLKFIDKITLAKVLNQFWNNINPHIIYRYDVFKRKAYDADITTNVFNLKEGIAFYEKMILINNSPFVKHQYAIFLQRKEKYDLAWSQIDQAYTESKKKVFTIANTHAVILFEMNIGVEANSEGENLLLKETMRKSFTTLEYCITQDVRINYHVLTYSRNTIRYYKKYEVDQYTRGYVESSLKQLEEVLSKNDYMYRGLRRELQTLRSELMVISASF